MCLYTVYYDKLYSSSLFMSFRICILALSKDLDIISESDILPAFLLQTIPAMLKKRSTKALVAGIFCMHIYKKRNLGNFSEFKFQNFFFDLIPFDLKKIYLLAY